MSMALFKAKTVNLSLVARKKCNFVFFLKKTVFLCIREIKIIYFCPIILPFLQMSLTEKQDPTTVP